MIKQLAIFAIAGALYAQAPPPEPQLSTAERTAIQALENQKKQAQEQFVQAQQAESTIEREFSMNHAGWHVNAQTLAVEKDVKPAVPLTPKINKP